ncbi:SMC-Scp complex subunit ScpB [Thalassotalea sp. HSM 43]|uniref:SMC-Scp complex subunit ScpB n=1 Tax=Thalassotalea sp. HSM 43 TaxID=2552945 RepID=UPI001081375A|nr:SMC-Scp complex subunit ScpB [Thalassotalea sp. HSM 43]QBY05338.1 SMC-Scp complex subunit ScpB [Thalassotalea sp. HSM 43]
MAKIEDEFLKSVVESMLFVSAVPLSIKTMQETLQQQASISKKRLQTILQQLQNDYDARAIELVEVASGYRFQARQQFSDYIALLYKEKAPKYSRALLETLALIAYRQPITRGEIEDIRGVSVSSYIIRTLQERDWIRVVGHKEVPGRPALFATTKEFLDYFSLKSLQQLPPLLDISDIDVDDKQSQAVTEDA